LPGLVKEQRNLKNTAKMYSDFQNVKIDKKRSTNESDSNDVTFPFNFKTMLRFSNDMPPLP